MLKKLIVDITLQRDAYYKEVMMIAPLQAKPDEPSAAKRLRTARRVIADMLLPADDDRPAAIPAWKGWLLVAWMFIAMLVYALCMLGIIER
jgi:hypothetical protein